MSIPMVTRANSHDVVAGRPGATGRTQDAQAAAGGVWDERLLDQGLADPRPYSNLIQCMGQQQEGNCASFATIKEAMRTYGPRLFAAVEKTRQGYHVTMQDGYQVDLTRDDLRSADRALAAKGTPSREGAMGVLAFGAMAMRAVGEHRHGVTDLGAAFKDLDNGEIPDEVPHLLGLDSQLRPVGPKSQHFVASSLNHSVFVDAGRADHYGEAVIFDGTDTRARLVNRGFTLDPTPYPSALYVVTANPMPAKGLPAEVVAEIDNRHSEGNTVTSVQVGAAGSYAVISGRNGFLYHGVPTDLAAKIREVHDQQEIIKSVALSPSGGYGMIWGQNGYLAGNVPQALKDELRRLNQQKEDLTALALGPDNTFAVLFGKNGYTTQAPPELNEMLKKLHDGDSKIEGVALGPNGSWVVTFDRFGYQAHGVPSELLDKLRQVHDSGDRIVSVFLGSEGWAVTQART